MMGDVPGEFLQFFGSRQVAIKEKKGHLLKATLLGQVGDAVTTVQESGLSLVDQAERRFSGDHAFKAGTVARMLGVTCR
jgi:hypothetical protein